MLYHAEPERSIFCPIRQPRFFAPAAACAQNDTAAGSFGFKPIEPKMLFAVGSYTFGSRDRIGTPRRWLCEEGDVGETCCAEHAGELGLLQRTPTIAKRGRLPTIA